MLDVVHGGVQNEEAETQSGGLTFMVINVNFRNWFIKRNTSAKIDKLKLVLIK